MTYTCCLLALAPSARTGPLFELVEIRKKRAIIVDLALVVGPVYAFVSAELPDQHRGHPAD